MDDSLRGAAAIVGIGELKPERSRPGRDVPSLVAEAAYQAIQDAGLTKEDIDSFVMDGGMEGVSGFNTMMAEHMGIYPTFATGCDAQGAAGVTMALQAAAYVNAGLAKFVLCGMGAAIDGSRRQRPSAPRETQTWSSEFMVPFGPTVAANGNYAMIARRHEELYGTTVEKRAKVAADFRYNANHNPMAIFHDTPITIEDVVSSRIVADPLHLLECVMPCAGACAFVVTRADIARGMPHKPAYILGGALGILRNNLQYVGEITESPVGRAAPKAFALAGYGPDDVQVMEIYDSFTITVICELEDSGFCKKGEGGEWTQAHDLTFKGDKPGNTH